MIARQMLARPLRCIRSSSNKLLLRTLAANTTADIAPVSGAGVRACVLAILEQHKTLLHALDDATYTFASPLLQASIGQHTRHSLDHLRKPVEALLAADAAHTDVLIHYDVRARNTVIEHDRVAAIDQIEALQSSVRTLGTLMHSTALQHCSRSSRLRCCLSRRHSAAAALARRLHAFGGRSRSGARVDTQSRARVRSAPLHPPQRALEGAAAPSLPGRRCAAGLWHGAVDDKLSSKLDDYLMLLVHSIPTSRLKTKASVGMSSQGYFVTIVTVSCSSPHTSWCLATEVERMLLFVRRCRRLHLHLQQQ